MWCYPRVVWLERGNTGINGPSVGNGEEYGCWPGIWVSGPCPGEELFILCQLGLPVQGLAWGDPLCSHLLMPVCYMFIVEWLRRVLWSTLLGTPPLWRLTKKALLWPWSLHFQLELQSFHGKPLFKCHIVAATKTMVENGLCWVLN